MSFKLKPTKKMEDIMITMVDTKHNEMVEKFKQENECILPKLKELADSEAGIEDFCGEKKELNKDPEFSELVAVLIELLLSIDL